MQDLVAIDQLNLSSEEKLLLYCSRLSISDDLKHKIDEIFSEELDWNFMLECSGRHGISPLFYRNLKKINHDKDIPPEARKTLEERYYNNIERNTLLYAELGKVLTAFKKEGIETIVLKGAFLAEEIYKNIGLRTMGDIDLLIKEKDYRKVITELNKLKYSAPTLFFTEFHERFEMQLFEERSFINQDNKIKIDIHWDIESPLSIYKVNINKFWYNAKPTNIANIETLTFTSENLLQHLCLHVNKHNTFRSVSSGYPLRDYCDISEVTKHYLDKINWNYLVQNSKECEIEEPIFQGLSIAKDYFEAHVPEKVLCELKSAKLNIKFEEIYKGISKRDQSVTINYFFYVGNVKGTWNKLNIIFGNIFPSKKYMMQRYFVTNENKIYRYYIFRLGTSLKWGLATLWHLPRYLLRYISWK